MPFGDTSIGIKVRYPFLSAMWIWSIFISMIIITTTVYIFNFFSSACSPFIPFLASIPFLMAFASPPSFAILSYTSSSAFNRLFLISLTSVDTSLIIYYCQMQYLNWLASRVKKVLRCHQYSQSTIFKIDEIILQQLEIRSKGLLRNCMHQNSTVLNII
jgi:hypothetical protein